MIAGDPLTQHNRMFQSVAGASCGLVAVLCMLLTFYLHEQSPPEHATPLLLAFGVMFVAFYRFPLLLSARELTYMLPRAALRWALAGIFILLGYVLVPGVEAEMPFELLITAGFISLPCVLVALTLLRSFAERLYGKPGRRRLGAILCPGERALVLWERLARSPAVGIKIEGYYGTPVAGHVDPRVSERCLGSVDHALAQIAQNRYQIVFVDTAILQSGDSDRILYALSDATAAVYVIPEPPAGFDMGCATLVGIPVLTLHETGILGLARVLKRGMDIILAALAILMLSPLLAGAACAVKLSSPGPILFRQKRAGEGGRAIDILKFRSMYVHQEQGGITQAQRNDPRVTAVGRIIRRTSIDELPQLFNVLGGSMSLVGPRPHAMAHNEVFRKQVDGYMLRHTVKPGITGWAQVNGLRGETDTVDKMRRRVEFDRYYIRNWSPLLDLKILFRTAWMVVGGRNAY